MTQEEKQLLLKDLCARLPYKPIVTFVDKKGNVSNRIDILNGFGFSDRNFPYFSTESGFVLGPDEIRPYLRPMSSMTDKEETLFRCELPAIAKTDAQLVAMRMELFLKGHLDFNHLIEKGLALEAPEGMYKTE